MIALGGRLLYRCLAMSRTAPRGQPMERHATTYATAQSLRLHDGLAAETSIEDTESRIAEKLDHWRAEAKWILYHNVPHLTHIALALLQRGR